MTAPLASTEDYETFTGATADARVAMLLDMASATVRRYTGQLLSYVEDDEVTVTPRDGFVRLPQRPVIEVTEVVRSGVTLDASSYAWTRQGLLQGPDDLNRFDLDLVWGCVPLTVTYTHGFETIPDDLIEVVLNTVRRKMSASGGELLQESETIGGYVHFTSYRNTADFTDDERLILNSYRMPVGSIDTHPAWT